MKANNNDVVNTMSLVDERLNKSDSRSFDPSSPVQTPARGLTIDQAYEKVGGFG